MSRNFQLLQQTSSVEDLFETASNPAGLVGAAECEPRPRWSEEPEQVEKGDNPAGHLRGAKIEKRPRWGEEAQKLKKGGQNELDDSSREEENRSEEGGEGQ